MKLSAVLLVAASLVAAQKVTDYFPDCSIDCLTDSVSSVSDCDLDDAWCICVQATYEEITTHGTSCILLECGPDVALGEVLPAAIPYCEAATSSHEAGAKATTAPEPEDSSSPSATTTSESAANTTDEPASTKTEGADAPETSGEGDEEEGDDDESAAAKAAPALLAMLALGAAAAF